MKEKKTKLIHFDYYQVVYSTTKELHSNKTDLFNLRRWILKVNRLNHEEKILEYGYDKIILNSSINHNDTYMFLNFNRMSDMDLPLVTDGVRDGESVELEDDEYLTKNITALFDERYCILLVQRSRQSVGHAGLEKYFNYIWRVSNPNDTIFLRPLIKPDSIERISKAENLTKLRLKFADIEPTLFNQGIQSMKSFLKSIQKFDAIEAELIISAKNKKKSLNREAVMEVVHDIHHDKQNLKLAMIYKKDSEDHQVDMVNLIEDHASESEIFTLNRRESLNSNEIRERMLELYEENSWQVIQTLNIRE